MTILSFDDANQQYRGCLIEYEGTLGFVREVLPSESEGTTARLAVKFVGQRTNRLIDANPDKVLCPCDPYRLGYVQVDEVHATYLSRAPRRQYQVGWSEGNVRGYDYTALSRMGTRLVDNLMGLYPSYQEALQTALQQPSRVAFDRMFAIQNRGDNDIVLCYKGSGIARIHNGVPDLAAQGLNHLSDILNKAMTER